MTEDLLEKILTRNVTILEILDKRVSDLEERLDKMEGIDVQPKSN